MILKFKLNGRDLELEVPEDARVVDILRDELKLTGTKESCGSGECGACAILLDQRAVLSCLMLAKQLEGREVTTVEGLGTPDNPHPLMQAFVSEGAVQCGYCTPGMIIASHDLLRKNPAPDRSEIRRGISGNLCRCTGYHKIVDAVTCAAEIMREKQ